MSRPQDNGGTWEVHCSAMVASSLKRLQQEATLQGRGEFVLAAFRHIVYRLEHDPLGLGEPLYKFGPASFRHWPLCSAYARIARSCSSDRCN